MLICLLWVFFPVVSAFDASPAQSKRQIACGGIASRDENRPEIVLGRLLGHLTGHSHRLTASAFLENDHSRLHVMPVCHPMAINDYVPLFLGLLPLLTLVPW